MKLYNTLTRKIEEFVPINPPNVGIYTCGPTVYGPGHLGHARSYTNFDLLKRTLIYDGYKVKHVLNITDVHDDMIKKAEEEGITIFELADRYIPLFKQDMVDLNVLPADFYPRVTEHIGEIIEMIRILIDKGFAYVEKDRSVYYDVSKFKDYGKLSGRKLDQAKTGTRVATDKYEKDEATDFALWKSALPASNALPETATSLQAGIALGGWESPWGKGRPGWHIECSAMGKKYLGKTFDLHAGAMDLKFPHHENEIAQSEAANGVKFVNYWFHGGLLEIEGKKMSKSLGNYLEIHEIKEKSLPAGRQGFEPLALRYLFLTVGYRDKLNFTWQGLQAAKTALHNLREIISNLKQVQKSESFVSPEKVTKIDSYKERFRQLINNDLAIPQALALVWEIVKSQISATDKLELVLDFDQILGLQLGETPARIATQSVAGGIPDTIKKLADEREKLRKAGKWSEADQVRKEIEKKGYAVEDTPGGSKILEAKPFFGQTDN